MSTPLSTTTACVYCFSPDTVKRGWREKKHEKVQLYLCRSCLRAFTPAAVKGKHYPIGAIIDALSYYNLGFSFEQVCKILSKKHNFVIDESAVPLPTLSDVEGTEPLEQCPASITHSTIRNFGSGISPSTIANWVDEFKDLCRYHRYRPYAVKMLSPLHTVVTATLAHRQLYRFRYHQAKIRLIIREDIKHANFGPLAEFLSLVPSETPHQYFQDGMRMSESPLKFSREGMIVRSKNNFANKLAAFALQGVKKNKDRHEQVQKFMLANDTVTVATEVPVYIRREDLAHMQTQLGFEMYAPHRNSRNRSRLPMLQSRQETKVPRVPRNAMSSNFGAGTPNPFRLLALEELPTLITGHIDLIQIRNGLIHILDYKPNAAKEKPIEQLTLYAMALSRLTGLRMYCFKCAWFDEKDYFEFFPLHVVYKGRGKKRKPRIDRKNILTKEGVYVRNESPTEIALYPTAENIISTKS